MSGRRPGRSGRIPRVGDPLTERDLRILTHLADGLTQKEIAARIGIAHNTVKFHMQRLFRRLGVVTSAGAVGRALRTGVIR